MVRARTSEAGPLATAKGVGGKGFLVGGGHHHGQRGGASGYQQQQQNMRSYQQHLMRGGSTVGKGGFDGPLGAPWRKTVSIFKQPVTLVHTTSRETKQATGDDIRRAQQQCASTANSGPMPTVNRTDKPKQVFWAKQLEGLKAMVPMRTIDVDKDSVSEHIVDSLALPSRFEPVLSVVGMEATAASLCSALQVPGGGHPSTVMGQTVAKKQLDVNPAVFANPDQPFIQAVIVQDSEVRNQEERVMNARRRLEEARKHFG